MYWLAFFNVILIVVASGLFIDCHFVRKAEDSDAFVGFLLIASVMGGLVLSMLTVIQGR